MCSSFKNAAAPSTINLLDEEDIYDFQTGVAPPNQHQHNGHAEVGIS